MILKLLLCCPERVPQRLTNPPVPVVRDVSVTVIVSTSQVPSVAVPPPVVGGANTVAASKSNLCDKKDGGPFNLQPLF